MTQAKVEGIPVMNENPYRTAGWLSIVAAALFPLAFAVSIFQGVIGIAKFRYQGPTIGPSDLLFIIFTVIAIYTLIVFRRLLNERYSFNDIDKWISITIGWNILFQVVSLTYRAIVIALWPIPQMTYTLMSIGFMVIFMPLGGIIDIVIAVKLLRAKDRFNDLIKTLAYLNMASGICGVTVILTPIALILVPIWWAVLAMVFLREKEEVEFV
jgi:hypothetical protein